MPAEKCLIKWSLIVEAVTAEESAADLGKHLLYVERRERFGHRANQERALAPHPIGLFSPNAIYHQLSVSVA
jgi:hypothetical protein